jgi:hypothetical protein
MNGDFSELIALFKSNADLGSTSFALFSRNFSAAFGAAEPDLEAGS